MPDLPTTLAGVAGTVVDRELSPDEKAPSGEPFRVPTIPAVSIDSVPERVSRHLASFNRAVETDSYQELAERFAPEAVMSFAGVPVGPYQGREAILAGYEEAPPDDTMEATSVSSVGSTDVVRFRWSRGGTGTMTMEWAGDLLAKLEVAFDE